MAHVCCPSQTPVRGDMTPNAETGRGRGSVRTRGSAVLGFLVSPALSPPPRRRGCADSHTRALLLCTRVSVSYLLCSLMKRKLIFIWIESCRLHSARAAGGEGGCGGRFHGVFHFRSFSGSFPECFCPRPSLLASLASPGTMSHIFQEKFMKREKQKFGKTGFSSIFDVKMSKAASTCFRPGPGGLLAASLLFPGMFWEHLLPEAS